MWPSAALLLAAIALAYANALEGPFLFDDTQPMGAFAWRKRPLVWLSFALNRWISAEATWSYHLFNVAVHAGCALLLLAFLRRALALAAVELAPRTRAALALVTSLVWALHPLQTQAVTYISQRAESLAAFFTLAFLYAFLRAATGAQGLGWKVLALFALTLGFATKEAAASAPILAWVLEATLLARAGPGGWRARRGFHLCLAASTLGLAWIFIAPGLLVEHSSSGFGSVDVTPLEYLRSQPGVLLHYLRLCFWPHPLCLDYAWPVAHGWRAVVLPGLGLVALLGLSVRALLARSWIGFAGAWFFVLLAPTSSFVPIRDLAVEHRMYLALASVALLAVVGVWRLCARLASRRTWLPPLLAGASLLALSAATVRRNRDYGSAITMWQSVVACNPRNPRAWENLSGPLIAAGRTEEAIEALQAVLALSPSSGLAYNNLAAIEMDAGRLEQAVATLTRAIVADPGYDVSYSNLGNCYLRLGQPARALPCFERALARLESPYAQRGLGIAHLELGDAARAAQHFRRALELDPTDAPARAGLERALAVRRP